MNGEGCCRHPVCEGRLLQVGESLQIGNHEITGAQHGDRDRYMPPFLRIEEPHCREKGQEQEGYEAQNQERYSIFTGGHFV